MPILPPGLQGFVAAQQQARAGEEHNLRGALGILNAQAQMAQQRYMDELKPLEIAAKRQALDQAQQNMQLRSGLMGILNGGGQQGAPAPLAFGEGGMSLPGGGQANAITGQTAPPAGVLQPGSAPMSGVLAGVNPMAALMMLSGDSGMGKLGGAIQEANKPIVARENAPILERGPDGGFRVAFTPAPKLEPGQRYDFGTGSVSTAPGFVESLRDIEGGKAGAVAAGRAPFEIKERQIGGRPYTMSDAEYAMLTGPDQYKAVQVASRYGIPYNGGVVGGTQSTSAPQPTAPGNMVVLSPTAQPGATGMGRIPSANVLPLNPTASESAASTATAKERAEGGVKFEQSVLDAGRSASSNLTNLQIIAPNLDKLPTGPMYPMILTMENYLQQIGLSVDKRLGPAQATDALLKQMALKMRDPAGGGGMPGALSDADRDFLSKTIPGLASSPQGNKMLVQILSAIEQRKIEEAGIVNRMQSEGMSSNDIRSALQQYGRSRSIAKGLR